MSSEKLDEQMSLSCPSCGGTEFDFDQPEAAADDSAEPEATTLLQCAKCGKEITYGDLVSANAESVDQHVQDIGAEFAENLKANLQDAIKKLGFK
ncbi:MAG: hypothetical protein EOP05_05540 [Proteobacteria bacterium]|nr:MAG: hypothetical protein EOP05_05540 [Pseudomonadota bacterium]